MKFGTRSSPRVKVVVGCLRSELVDEMMSSVAKTPIRGESDRFEVDVELLVGDDFVGVAALVVGVDVGGSVLSPIPFYSSHTQSAEVVLVVLS